MFEFFLKLSISKQIQLGVTIVVLISIILFQLLILIAIFIQMDYILSFFNSLLENEESSLMRNYNLMLEKHEILYSEKVKEDHQLLRLYLNNLLSNNYFMDYFDEAKMTNGITSKSSLLLSQSENKHNYFVKYIDSNEEKQLISVSLILEPVLNNLIQDDDSLYKGYKLYTKHSVFCYSKQIEKTNEQNNANQCERDLKAISSSDFIISQNINKSIEYITNILPKVNSQYNHTQVLENFKSINFQNPLFDLTSLFKTMSINYKENSSTKFNDYSTLINDFKYGIELELDIKALRLSDNIPLISNALFIITHLSGEVFISDDCYYLLAYKDLEEPNKNIININDCFEQTDASFRDNYLQNISQIDYTKSYSFIIHGQTQDSKVLDPNSDYRFRMSISNYPTNSSYILNTSKFIIETSYINYIIYNNNRKYSQKNILSQICVRYFIIIALFNYLLWGILIIYIFIRVLFISWKISKPIDDLIQSISQNNSIDNQAQDDLKKKLEKISYKDDYIINELFMLCKKLIIGGFKQFAEQQKKRMKMIQANDTNTNLLSDKNNSVVRVNECKRKDYFAQLEESSIHESIQSNISISIDSSVDEEISLMKYTPAQKDAKEGTEIGIKQKVNFTSQKNYLHHGNLNIFQENHFLCGYSFKKLFLNHEEHINQENEYYSILKSLGEGVALPKVNENDKTSPRKTLFRP